MINRRNSKLFHPPTLIFILISIGIYFFFAIASIHKPLVADEIFFPRDSAMLEAGTLAFSQPPFHLDLLRIWTLIFKLTGENLRTFNIFCFIITAFLIYLISQQIHVNSSPKNRNALGLIALFLYVTHPMAIQGSLLLDIDTSILNLLLVLFIFCFFKIYNNLDWRNRLLLGLLFFVCLWAKLSSPWAVIVSMFIFYCLNRGIKDGIKNSFNIALIGTVLFCIAWINYAHLYNIPISALSSRIVHPIQRGLGVYFISPFSEMAKRLIRIVLWLNPFLLLLGMVALVKRIKEYIKERSARPIDFCLLYVLILLFGYTFISGTIWSFPKYHYPLLAILVIIATGIIHGLDFKIDRNKLIFYIGMSAFFIFYNLLFVSDLIYLFNYRLRNAVILIPKLQPMIMRSFLVHLLLYLIALPLAISILKIRFRNSSFLRVVILSLFILVISSNFSLNIIQARATYTTHYCYGRNINDMRQLEAFFREVKNKNPERIIIGPMDVLYNAGLSLTEYRYDIIGKTAKKFFEAINDKRVVCVVYGISWNDLYFYRNILSDEAVRETLIKNYKYGKIGEYSVWLRRESI